MIKHSIREYRPNEIHASQWLDLFITQSVLSEERFDLKAEETLTELVDNNKYILTVKIKDETIMKFFEMI